MKHFLAIISVYFVLGFCLSSQQLEAMEKEIVLPAPKLQGEMSVERAINERRSKRRFSSDELTIEQISQLLWSAQGITQRHTGFRAAPSAGALYPMEIYLLNKDGVFRYLPKAHKLEQIMEEDLRRELAVAALGQDFIVQAPANIVVAAVYERITSRYGSRGRRYTDIEVGHIAQNVHLQAVALGLGSVPVGAFDDQMVKKLLKLSANEQPLYIIPVGYAR